MGKSKSLNWKGDGLKDRVRAASMAAINKVMQNSVEHAKENHPWQNQTGVLEGSIGIAELAMPHATGVKGVWGSKDLKYALIHELGGVINHPGGTPYLIGEDGKAVFVSKNSPGAANLPKTKPHQIVMPARPYLRPAADAKYPELTGLIQEALQADKAAKP